MEQKLINLKDIKVGDEIIISCHSMLKYLKVLRLPTKFGSDVFKCSVGRNNGMGRFYNQGFTFQMDVEKHNKVVYQNLHYRDVFLVKREE